METFDNSDIIETPVSRKRAFDGLILSIDHAQYRLPNGSVAPREIALHVGAAAVVPLDADGCVTLVRQFRAPLDRVMLEIPAGKLDSRGEDRLAAAKRELAEETGLHAGQWMHLTDMATTPGFCDEVISLYLARDLQQGEVAPDADEFLGIVRIPLGEVRAMVLRGEISDAKTICAVLMACAVIG